MEISTRPLIPEDEPFQRALFVAWKGPELCLHLLPEEVQPGLIDMQWAVHRNGLLAHFPNAARSLILADGAPAGAWAVEHGDEAIHLHEIALMPEYRGRGIGRALIGVLQEQARASGRPVRLHVGRFNILAANLYLQLGFVPEEDDGGVQLPMVWRAAGASCT